MGSCVWSISRRKPSLPPTHSMVGGSALTRPAPSEDGQHLLMQFAIADDDVRRVDVQHTFPIGVAAAGLFNNRFECRHVPGVDAVLDHDLARALGDKHMSIEIAEAALFVGTLGEGEKIVRPTHTQEPGQASVRRGSKRTGR